MAELEDGSEPDESLLSAVDVDHISTEALLWQTGYLTIVGGGGEDDDRFHLLGYPNLEVRRSLNKSLLAALTHPECARRHPDPRRWWLRAAVPPR